MSAAPPPPPSLNYLASLPRAEVAKVSRRIKDNRKRAKFLGLILKARVVCPPHDCASKPAALGRCDKLEALPPAPARLRSEQDAIDALSKEMSKRILWFLNRAQPEFALIKRDSRNGHPHKSSRQMIETAIRLVEAEKLGCHPKILFGRFNATNELVHALACDDAGCRSWCRERGESAEGFEMRVTRDLAELVKLPALVASA